ncbi:hypothetical protein PG990_004331 [Apiospora arundinis]
MTSLEATLKDVKAVVQHLEHQSWGDLAQTVKFNIANLQDFAKQCSDDIASWVQVTAGLDLKRKSGFRAFFRKLRLTMSGPDTLRSFEADVAKHRQNISNSLATLTVSLVLKGHMSIGELSSKLDQFSDTQRKASEVIFNHLGHAAEESIQPAAITDDSAERPLVQLLQNVQTSLENRFDALSEVLSIDRGQRDQEIRSLYASSQGSAPYMTPVSGDPVHESPQLRPMRPPEHRGSSAITGPFDMASICSSLSSIAVSLSALPHQHSPRYSGLQQTNDTNPLKRRYSVDADMSSIEWACDALSGIDVARYPSEEDPQLELCLFCGKGFMMKTLDDPYNFGKHLVYEHSFGKCDLNESFGSWEELQDHLEQFHRAGNFDATSSSITGSLGLLHFKRRVRLSSPEHPYFCDAAGKAPGCRSRQLIFVMPYRLNKSKLIMIDTEASKDLDMYERYAKETDLRLQTELLQLLVEAGILEPRDLANPSFRPDLTCAIKILNTICRVPGTRDDTESRTRRSKKAAMIEEQLIVAGYATAIQARICPDFKHLYHELCHSSLLPTNRTRTSQHRGDKDLMFSCVWTMTDAYGRYCGGSLDQEPSRICSSCGDKVLPSAVRTHLRHTKGGPVHTASFNDQILVSCERPSSSRVIAVPRGLRASLATMQELCGSTLAHRISKWLLVSFLDSASQRELLRTSPLTVAQKRPLPQNEGGGGHSHAEENWVGQRVIDPHICSTITGRGRRRRGWAFGFPQ